MLRKTGNHRCRTTLTYNNVTLFDSLVLIDLVRSNRTEINGLYDAIKGNWELGDGRSPSPPLFLGMFSPGVGKAGLKSTSHDDSAEAKDKFSVFLQLA